MIIEDFDVFDDDGYPTDRFLNLIEEWHHTDGFYELMEYAMSGHTYPQFRDRSEQENGDIIWNVSTGGWSGNESIIDALNSNWLFWSMCWESSRRGGHHVFRIRRATE
jgi:hypothetical protein